MHARTHMENVGSILWYHQLLEGFREDLYTPTHARAISHANFSSQTLNFIRVCYGIQPEKYRDCILAFLSLSAINPGPQEAA